MGHACFVERKIANDRSIDRQARAWVGPPTEPSHSATATSTMAAAWGKEMHGMHASTHLRHGRAERRMVVELVEPVDRFVVVELLNRRNRQTVGK